MGQNDMVSNVSRIRWWKYRFVLIALFLLNVFLIHHFFFDGSNVNPFRDTPPTDKQVPSPEAPTPPTPPSSPSLQGPPTKDTHPEQPKGPVKPSAPAPPSAPSPAPAPSQALALTPPAPSPETFTFNLNDYDFYGDYVGWPLERVCKETPRTEGLIFICDNNTGGIGNIRNFILTCVRYAIHVGASGITMPVIQIRDENNLGELFTAKTEPLSYFFDEDHFRTAMSSSCPQLKVYDTLKDIPNHDNITKVEEFVPKELGGVDGTDGRGTNRHLDVFRPNFNKWIAETKHTPTATAPITIRFRWATFFEWPIFLDGSELAATFGDLLRINKEAEALAHKTLLAMSRFVGVEPQSENPKTLDAPFMGIHLRTESDALGYWPDYKEQSTGYLKEAADRGFKHAFLACGNATEKKRFADEAWENMKLNVTSKLDLLKGEDLERLQALTWDQQALVDFLVLLKSRHFAGCSFSSFAMNISLKRHLVTGGLRTRPWQSPSDGYSTLVGRFKSWWGDWMYMLECMWP
ncbi:uncharacterized protein BP5553_09012 [Venustampulla echinocandica]|uniref:Alternative oxidase n=1 Tax=Venustampulla echinocandica TaxID=2656787 RepID=A0A370TDM3_9HELO|nr:uncharacterized protein BP5553_09012 [Venustampulla echinocandica]RDL32556.1 hypothetical protein BP5553_09012 [Venustampulla echinocandica]